MLDLSLPTKSPVDESSKNPAGMFAVYSLVNLGPNGIDGLKTALVRGFQDMMKDDQVGHDQVFVPPQSDFSGQRLRNVYDYHLNLTSGSGSGEGVDSSWVRAKASPDLFIVAYSPNYHRDGVLLVCLDTDGERNVSSCSLETAEALSAAMNLDIANMGWEEFRGPMIPVHVPQVLPHMVSETYELWGGHAHVKLPRDYLDASEVRPVPDHQEIFVNNSKDLESRNSVVISLCEAVTNDTKSDHEALVFHIIDQLDDEGPCLAMCETVPVSMEKFPRAPALMTQTMSKPQEAEDGTLNFVVQYFLLLRLESKETDVLVTVNVPHAAVRRDALEKDPMTDPDDPYLAQGRQMIQDFAETFEIVDWSFLG